ncbi:E3 ubiquitin-protein ligase TRIM71-like [Dreissena polymorpha]|nr:E3 ubiquitin-protein ligase TRIM71-like [Dreissena polymorpha]
MGPMNLPKMLPCLHNACKQCLQQHILSHVRQELQLDIQPKSFPCPVCERDTAPAEAGIGCEKWATAFPTNNFLHVYCMILAVQREEVDCDPCQRRGESTLATWWCRECSEYQCNVCKTVHSGFKIFKDHNVISVKEIAQNPHVAIPKFEPCHFHREKITHFCRDHRVPCCSKCMVAEHRKCEHVVTTETEYRKLEGRGGYDTLIETLTKYEDMVVEMIDTRRNIVEELEAKRQSIVDQVQQVREQFEDEMRRLEDKLLEEFDRCHQLEINQLNELTTECENLGKQITNAVKLVETVQQQGSETHILSFIEKAEKECREYETKLRECKSKIQHVTYEFTADQILENVLKSTKSFGNIGIKRSKQIKSENIIRGARLERRGVKEVKRLRVWIAGDRGRCNISGGVYLEDGRILLADHDNFKVKLFSSTGRLLSKIVLKSKPSDIAMIDKSRYVVPYPSCSAIQFIHLEGKVLREGDYVDTARTYHCLAIENDHIYLVTQSGIAVCDIEACAEKNFIKLKDLGLSTFKSPCNIRASASGLVITDSERHSVNFLSLDGRLLHCFKASGLKCPMGLGVDDQGNVFVCGNQSSNVHQLSEDGQTLRMILQPADGVENPAHIAFQLYGNKFFVSDSKISARDVIKIFRWK